MILTAQQMISIGVRYQIYHRKGKAYRIALNGQRDILTYDGWIEYKENNDK